MISFSFVLIVFTTSPILFPAIFMPFKNGDHSRDLFAREFWVVAQKAFACEMRNSCPTKSNLTGFVQQ